MRLLFIVIGAMAGGIVAINIAAHQASEPLALPAIVVSIDGHDYVVYNGTAMSHSEACHCKH